jgi:hypothetical protein
MRNTCNLYSDDESAVAETNDNDCEHDDKTDQNSRRSGGAFTWEGISNYVGQRETVYNIWGTM